MLLKAFIGIIHKPLFILLQHTSRTAVSCHLSYVIVSECLHHDTTAVHLYQRCFIAFLQRFLPARSQPRKIIYFSDGAASQYKNRKNFINLCHHKEDFGIAAEWHFSATTHGKGACDGLGGTVKRLAACASLQKPYSDQIMTSHQLFDWATNNIPILFTLTTVALMTMK